MSSEAPRNNWFEDHPGKTKLLVFVFCLLLVEGIVRIVVWAGLLPYERYPTSREPQYWSYIDPVVGIWRHPHADFVDMGRCYTAHYTSNSVGARDRERAIELDARRRVVVLGDSFVEGYGYDESSRFTEILEEKSGIEFMNWGTSGAFGTIQEWLLYESKVKAYDHSDVMLFLLPDNDFKDNDPSEYGSDTYRPYLRKDGEEYEVYYPVAFEDRFTASRTMGQVIKNTLDNSVYILNALRLANRIVKDRSKAAIPGAPKPTYEQYSDEDLEVFLYALGEIALATEVKRLHLFLIPRPQDMAHAETVGYDFELVRELEAFAGRYGHVEFLDLLPGMLAYAKDEGLDFEDFTLGCDGHWGRHGHEATAELVFDYFESAGSPTPRNP